MADQTPAFRNGWRGVMEGEVRELTKESVQGILHRGGTILGSSGANPYHEGRIEKVRQTFADLALDELIAIGSEGTLGAAAHMTEEGMSVIGVPKTIDNDLSGSEACIGSARPFRSPPTPSTGCTAPPRATTASSWRR